jgi:prefoldin subunit 5
VGRNAFADYISMKLQTAAKATEFYNGKVKELETNLQDLEKIVQGKSQNLRVIEDGKLPHTLIL